MLAGSLADVVVSSGASSSHLVPVHAPSVTQEVSTGRFGTVVDGSDRAVRGQKMEQVKTLRDGLRLPKRVYPNSRNHTSRDNSSWLQHGGKATLQTKPGK
jgi:hypothetical protein